MIQCDDPLHGPPEVIEWHNWASRLHARGWKQVKCRKCGEWIFKEPQEEHPDDKPWRG
jgi:hypothetical protein